MEAHEVLLDYKEAVVEKRKVRNFLYGIKFGLMEVE